MTDAPAQAKHSAALRQTLFFAAFLLYGVTIGRSTPVAGLVVFLATCALVFAALLRSGPDGHAAPRTAERRLFMGIVLYGVLGMSGWAPSSIGPSSWVLERGPGVIWVILAWVTLRTGRSSDWRIRRAVLGVTLFGSLLFGILHISATNGVGYDVLFLHEEAAGALAQGQSPYTDVVEVPNGSPTAQPGDVISGYVYPPVTAIAYSIGEWLLDDPRYISLISWLVVLGLLGYRALSRRSTQALLATILLAGLPGWPLVLRAAWSEPLSLALFMGALVTWRRPTASGVWTGLALASKQYFVVTAPLLLFNRFPGWRARMSIAVVMIAGTIGAALLWDPGAFWSAAVEFHMSTPPRPDSVNLIGLVTVFGLAWHPPTWLALVLGLATAAVVALRGHQGEDLLLGVGAALAVSFLVTTQAFANYWFLVAGLCVVAISGTDQPSRATSRDVRATRDGHLARPTDS